MVALFVVLLVAVVLAIDVVLQMRHRPSLADRLRARAEADPAGSRVAGFRHAPDVAVHPGHTWARRTGTGMARVGVDDFAAHLIGRPERIDTPAIGSTVRAGRPLLSFQRGRRKVQLVSPVSGTVAAVNRDALARTDAVVTDPFESGWLVEIRSTEMAYDFRSLLSGELARRFLDEAAATLHAYMAPGEMAPAAADGGEPIVGISDQMDDPTWDRACARFLLTDGP